MCPTKAFVKSLDRLSFELPTVTGLEVQGPQALDGVSWIFDRVAPSGPSNRFVLDFVGAI
jgi:hypothetical protein